MLDAWAVPAQPVLEVAENVVLARMAQASGDQQGAVDLFRKAAESEDTIPYMEPPYWYYPVRQSLGAALLQTGKADEAEKEFLAALDRARGSAWALFGLQQAAKAKAMRPPKPRRPEELPRPGRAIRRCSRSSGCKSWRAVGPRGPSSVAGQGAAAGIFRFIRSVFNGLSGFGRIRLESPFCRRHFDSAQPHWLPERKEREKMNTSALIRPAWTPATIALMVLGFMVFWPLGLAMLAYILWGDRFDGFKRDFKGAKANFFGNCRSPSRPAITASAGPATSPSTIGARRSWSGSRKSAAGSTRR